MKKKLLTLLLAVAMVFTLGACGEKKPVMGTDATATEPVVVLHTNDVHGAIENYAKVAVLADQYAAEGAYVLVLDAGDFSQGTTSVSLSQGATAIELMNMVGYDAVALGNHEFDYGYEVLKQNMASADFPVLAANVKYNGELAFDDAAVFTTPGGTKIGVFGLDTPETATKAHPGKIAGVTFAGGEEMYQIAQDMVTMLREEEGCNYVICIGHLGIDDETAVTANRSIDLLAKVTGIDVFIDGHSHSTEEEIAEKTNADRKVGDTVLTSTGTKLENIGVVTIKDSTITTECVPTEGIEVPADNEIAARAAAIAAQVEAEYGTVFAKTEVTLNGEKAPGNRTEETNLGDLITDALVWRSNLEGESVDGAITNGGGIRATIETGDITKKDINTVLPFGNTLYIVKVTGAELLEALEASTYCTPEAIGGFPHVSGINYTINTGAPYDTTSLYPDSTYGKPDSINRVMIQTVGGEAFDPNETYTIVTNDFLGAGGDTYYAFKASPIGYDLGVPLDEVVMDYITTQLGGVVTEADYGSTQSRINTISYTDVTVGDWYANAVTYVTLTGLMNGVGDAFQPNTNLTRAMMVTVLYRMAGEPQVTQANPFQDVAADTWYTNAVIWASETGITTGATETTFAPTKALTREQLAAFFYRFAQYESGGEIPAAGDNLAAFTDAGSISSYATDAVNWAVGEGLISGVGNSTLAPQNSATRAQVATILMRYTAE